MNTFSGRNGRITQFKMHVKCETVYLDFWWEHGKRIVNVHHGEFFGYEREVVRVVHLYRILFCWISWKDRCEYFFKSLRASFKRNARSYLQVRIFRIGSICRTHFYMHFTKYTKHSEKTRFKCLFCGFSWTKICIYFVEAHQTMMMRMIVIREHNISSINEEMYTTNRACRWGKMLFFWRVECVLF